MSGVPQSRESGDDGRARAATHVVPGVKVDVAREDSDRNHWLVRPRTVRRLWIGGLVVLALTVVAEIAFPVKGHYGWDDWPGFGAVFGFASCVVMVLVAKGLGVLLKRPAPEVGDDR